jgi:predicted Zn-dependent protease
MATEQAGSLSTALQNGHKLLAVNPARAEEQAREILKALPNHPMAMLLLASARRAQSDNAGARAILEPLARAHPRIPAVHSELGTVLAALGETRAAIAAFRRTAQIEPGNPAVWRMLGNLYTLAGESQAADDAYAQGIKASVNDPELVNAATALCDGRLAVAERLLRDFLKRNPTDVAAIRMLAETASRLAAYEDAESLLARALELAPSFTPARHNYAVVLHRQFKSEAALKQIDLLLDRDPNNPAYRTLRAAVLVRIGEYHEAIKSYEILLREQPALPKAWMSYGHALKTVGRQDESVDAYRKSIALLPKLGESYWSLANLKTFRFSDAEIAAMQALLAATDLTSEDRYHLEFALGKALEDKGAFAQSFAHYVEGNALRRKSIPYDVDATSAFVQRSKTLFSQTFFRERAGSGSRATDPIFIVGLPRAGSTLVEQILSSHSQIEGTMELPDLLAIARRLGGSSRKADLLTYLDALPALDADACAALGGEYLDRTRIQRKLARPFFIDKMPNNFHHIALIQLILPHARIIDARRHPLGCCLSNFKQHYAHGQAFAYDLDEIGRYYRDYVELMAHFDAVLPGRIHRVIYENMVSDSEAEIHALLDYCDLPFEESCLRYYENDRAVRTASSEQVRKPNFTEAVEQWRNYEEWLGPLKAALGPVLETYPEVPVFQTESAAADN